MTKSYTNQYNKVQIKLSRISKKDVNHSRLDEKRQKNNADDKKEQKERACKSNKLKLIVNTQLIYNLIKNVSHTYA